MTPTLASHPERFYSGQDISRQRTGYLPPRDRLSPARLLYGQSGTFSRVSFCRFRHNGLGVHTEAGHPSKGTPRLILLSVDAAAQIISPDAARMLAAATARAIKADASRVIVTDGASAMAAAANRVMVVAAGRGTVVNAACVMAATVNPEQSGSGQKSSGRLKHICTSH